jgi:hypothetical protein
LNPRTGEALTRILLKKQIPRKARQLVRKIDQLIQKWKYLTVKICLIHGFVAFHLLFEGGGKMAHPCMIDALINLKI